MSNRHKWYKEIQAWSEGAEIEQFSYGDGVWGKAIYPIEWDDSGEYRIKTQPKEPKYLYVYQTGTNIHLGQAPHPAMNMYETIILGKIEVQDD